MTQDRSRTFLRQCETALNGQCFPTSLSRVITLDATTWPYYFLLFACTMQHYYVHILPPMFRTSGLHTAALQIYTEWFLWNTMVSTYLPSILYDLAIPIRVYSEIKNISFLSHICFLNCTPSPSSRSHLAQFALTLILAYVHTSEGISDNSWIIITVPLTQLLRNSDFSKPKCVMQRIHVLLTAEVNHVVHYILL